MKSKGDRKWKFFENQNLSPPNTSFWCVKHTKFEDFENSITKEYKNYDNYFMQKATSMKFEF